MLSTILSVLLLILKIIGIILLVVLGLILLILLVPIRYNFELSAPEGQDLKEHFSAGAGVKWFLVLIRARISCLGTKINYEVKILGKTILGNDPAFLKKKEEKARKKEASARKKEEESPELPPTDQSGPENTETEDADSVESEAAVTGAVIMETESTESDPAEVQSTESDLEQTESADSEPSATGTGETEAEYSPTRTPTYPEELKGQATEEKGGEKKEEKKKKKEKKEKTKQKEGEEKRKTSITDKIEAVKNKITEGRQFMDEYQVISLIGIAKDALIRLLKHLLPRRIKGWIRYGFDDPSATGYVAAVSALFYPSYHRNFSLEADFQEACFAGECHGKGRIRLGYLLWILITLLLKKEVRKLIRFILK